MGIVQNLWVKGLLKAACTLPLTANAAATPCFGNPDLPCGSAPRYRGAGQEHMDGGALMLDTGLASEYVDQHIVGAKSVPHKEDMGRDRSAAMPDGVRQSAQAPARA